MRAFFLILLLLASAAVADTTNEAASLLPNGGFEQPDPTNSAKPFGWDLFDGLGVKWEAESADNPNRVIRMNTAVSEKDYVASCRRRGLEKWVFPNATNDSIAGTYGLSYYSDSIPVSTGIAYRITFRYKGASGGAKAWIRGYGLIRGEERRRFDTIVNCRTSSDGWNTLTQCFHPTRMTPTVTRMRVMLFAYWPPGVYEFDDVRITPVSVEEWERDHRENE
jgi:hypothetical protein